MWLCKLKGTFNLKIMGTIVLTLKTKHFPFDGRPGGLTPSGVICRNLAV